MSLPFTIRSDPASHFTGAIAQNAMEVEALDAPSASFTITRIALMAEENLDWDVVFFANANGNDADPADNALIDSIPLRASDINGRQIAGTGLFLYGVSDFRLPIQSDSRALHVGLVCRSAAGKTASAGGGAVTLVVGGELS